MTRVFLVRHGETQWNKEFRYQGHSDIALSERGKAQARLLAQRLASEEIQAVFSSDLSRARLTAEILAEPHGLKVITMKELRETCFGCWEGMTFAEIDQAYGEVYRAWRSDPLNIKIPGGESLAEVMARVMGAMEKIISSFPEGNVIVVGHGGMIRVIVSAILGIDLKNFWRLRQDNMALNIIEFYDQGGILCLYNDTSHLKDFPPEGW